MEGKIEISPGDMKKARKMSRLKLIDRIKNDAANIRSVYRKYLGMDVKLHSYNLWEGIFKDEGKYLFFAIWSTLILWYFCLSPFCILWNYFLYNTFDFFTVIAIFSFLSSFFWVFVLMLSSALPFKIRNFLRILKKYGYYYLFTLLLIFITDLITYQILPISSVSVLRVLGSDYCRFSFVTRNLPVGAGYLSLIFLIVFYYLIYRISFSPSFLAFSNIGIGKSLWLSWKLTHKCGECFNLYIKSTLAIVTAFYIAFRIPPLTFTSLFLPTFLLAITFSVVIPSFTMMVARNIYNHREELV